MTACGSPAAPVEDPVTYDVTFEEPIARPAHTLPPRKAKPERKPTTSRSSQRSPVRPAWAVQFQRCVIGHESATSGLYKAENPTSSASGAYQFVDGTWQHYARLAGYGKYRRASDAPPSVQDAVFFKAVMMRDFYHWKGTHCGYGT